MLRASVSALNRPRPLTGQAFIDLNWLDRQILNSAAVKSAGERYALRNALDAGSLRPYLESKTAAALGGKGVTLDIRDMYAYGTYGNTPKSKLHIRRNVDLVRALTEDGVVCRTFTSQQGNACAPAIALAVDMVHACAIRGDVDNGQPVTDGAAVEEARAVGEHYGDGAVLRPADVVLGVLGSPQYLPAVLRAAQHGRTAAIVTTTDAWSRLTSAVRDDLNGIVVHIPIEEALESMVTTLAEFRATAMPPGELARELADSMIAHVGMGRVLSGSELAMLLTQVRLLKELRKVNMTLRQLVSGNLDVFSVKIGLDGRWSVSVRARPPKPAVVVSKPIAVGGAPLSATVAESSKSQQQLPPPQPTPLATREQGAVDQQATPQLGSVTANAAVESLDVPSTEFASASAPEVFSLALNTIEVLDSQPPPTIYSEGSNSLKLPTDRSGRTVYAVSFIAAAAEPVSAEADATEQHADTAGVHTVSDTHADMASAHTVSNALSVSDDGPRPDSAVDITLFERSTAAVTPVSDAESTVPVRVAEHGAGAHSDAAGATSKERMYGLLSASEFAALLPIFPTDSAANAFVSSASTCAFSSAPLDSVAIVPSENTHASAEEEEEEEHEVSEASIASAAVPVGVPAVAGAAAASDDTAASAHIAAVSDDTAAAADDIAAASDGTAGASAVSDASKASPAASVDMPDSTAPDTSAAASSDSAGDAAVMTTRAAPKRRRLASGTAPVSEEAASAVDSTATKTKSSRSRKIAVVDSAVTSASIDALDPSVVLPGDATATAAAAAPTTVSASPKLRRKRAVAPHSPSVDVPAGSPSVEAVEHINAASSSPTKSRSRRQVSTGAAAVDTTAPLDSSSLSDVEPTSSSSPVVKRKLTAQRKKKDAAGDASAPAALHDEYAPSPSSSTLELPALTAVMMDEPQVIGAVQPDAEKSTTVM